MFSDVHATRKCSFCNFSWIGKNIVGNMLLVDDGLNISYCVDISFNRSNT